MLGFVFVTKMLSIKSLWFISLHYRLFLIWFIHKLLRMKLSCSYGIILWKISKFLPKLSGDVKMMQLCLYTYVLLKSSEALHLLIVRSYPCFYVLRPLLGIATTLINRHVNNVCTSSVLYLYFCFFKFNFYQISTKNEKTSFWKYDHDGIQAHNSLTKLFYRIFTSCKQSYKIIWLNGTQINNADLITSRLS